MARVETFLKIPRVLASLVFLVCLLFFSPAYACDTSSGAAWCANYYAASWNGWTSCTFTEVPAGSCMYVTARLERNGSYWGTSYFSAGTAASSTLVNAMASGQASFANGIVTYNNGATFNSATLAVTPPPPPTMTSALTGLFTTGQLYDASGQPAGFVSPSDLAAMQQGQTSCETSGSTSHCSYTGPSGVTYNTYLPVPESLRGQANYDEALAIYFEQQRIANFPVWDNRDLSAEQFVNSHVGTNHSVEVSPYGIESITRSPSGGLAVDVEIFSTPQLVGSGGGGGPGTSHTVPSTMRQKIQSQEQSGVTVSNTDPASSLPGSSPLVQDVEHGIQDIARSGQIPNPENVTFYLNPEGSGVTAVNNVTGQAVGHVHFSGQNPTSNQVTEVYNNLTGSGSTYISGGTVVLGNYNSGQSGNVSPNTGSGGATLPTGVATQAGTGSGSYVLNSQHPFYNPRYSGQTFNSIFDSHFTNVSQTAFVSSLRSMVPNFGGGSVPRWCFSTARLGSHCLDMAQYAYVFAVLKAIVLLSTAYACYGIALKR